jgi:hypothetical protein
MNPPSPRSARLLEGPAKGRPPSPPFGIAAWTADGEAAVIQLDATESDLSSAEAVAAQLPDAASLPARTLVVLLGNAGGAGGVWRRILFMKDAKIPRAPRASALLMRGYVEIGAAKDAASSHDLVWAWSP